MGWEINWHTASGNTTLLQSPYYQTYNTTYIGALDATSIKNDIKACKASNESAEIIAYLCWLLRVLALVA
jgi:hypothetical protein